MQLIEALGSREMQNALGHPYVRKIVDILLQVIDQDYFRSVALLLKDHGQSTSPTFTQKLLALRMRPNRPNAEGRFVVPPYIDELTSTLKALYEQNQETVNFQRGAIVELLASELICSRCKSDECKSNHRFIDRSYTSGQLDVAVLSENRQQIEGYACKIKGKGIMSEDCGVLIDLARKAQELDYDVHVGAICFDHSHAIRQRLQDRLQDYPLAPPVAAYGIDNIRDLQESPF